MKLQKFFLICVSALMVSIVLGISQSTIAYAEVDLKEAEKSMNAFKDINVFETKEGTKPPAESVSRLNSLLILALTVGGFVVVYNLIISGMKLSASMNNPQARSNAVIGLLGSFFGGWMLYKCLDIVGWFGVIFSNSTGGKEGLVQDLNALLIILLGIGGFVVVLSIIFVGTKLATSQTNPNARRQAFGGIVTALLGAYIVYNSLKMAGWIGSF